MEKSYCRLCAVNKSLAQQINLIRDKDKFLEIKLKLKLLHVVTNISNDDYLLITVCIDCYNSLTRACEFIDKITKAQIEISKLTKSNRILHEASSTKTADVLVNENNSLKIKEEGLNLKQDVDNSWCSYLWICSHCSRLCEDAGQLRKHSIEEHGSCCAFSCADCSNKFESYNQFIDHVRNHRSYLRNYCKFCDSLESPETCNDHEKWHENNFDICKACGKSFCENESLSVISQHKKIMDSITINIKKETKRKKSFDSDNLLESLGVDNDQNDCEIPKEIETQSWNNYPWICRICDVVFSNVNNLRSHLKTEHKRCAAFKCFDCNFRLEKNSFYYFTKHVGKHRENLSKICCYCNLHKSSFKDIQLHIKEEHHKSYYCKKCGEPFKSESDLKVHLKKYRPPKRIRNRKISMEDKTCKICNKVFCSPKSLMTHTDTVHLGKRNFTCEQCGSRYCSNYKLQMHITIKHENKKFKCKLCEKTFTSKYGLVKHIKSHSTEKPYSCEYCGHSFKLQSLLKNHKTIHMDVKPFTCKVCNKSFRLKSFLKRHEVIHTGMKPYSCKICNVAYANRENCYNHMKKKHNVQPSNHRLDEIPFDKDMELWKNTIMVNGNRGQKRKKTNMHK